MRFALLAMLAACGKDTTDDSSATDDTAETEVVDPCEADPCHNGGTCANDGGAAVCTCVAPYEGPTCDATPRYFPAGMDTALGDNFQDFGIHSRVQLLLRDTTAPTDPVEITSLRMRRDDTTNVDTLSFAQVIVKLGPAVATMQDDFDDNFASAPTVVYDGALSIGSNGTDTVAFDDWVIVVDPPYAWDPADGQLLVELLFPDGHQTQPNMRIDCNNDAMIYMRMSNVAYSGGPPTTANNLSGCGYALAIGMQ